MLVTSTCTVVNSVKTTGYFWFCLHGFTHFVKLMRARINIDSYVHVNNYKKIYLMSCLHVNLLPLIVVHNFQAYYDYNSGLNHVSLS